MSAPLTRVAAGALVIGLVAALSACASSAPAATEAPTDELDLSGVTLTLGEQTTELSPFIKASGVFDDAPYTVEYASFAAPADNLAANASGSVDLSFVAEWTGLQAASNTQPAWTPDTAQFTNILETQQGLPDEFDFGSAIVTTASGFESLEDSKGGRWGFIPNSFWNLFAAKTLADLGWTEDDVEIVHLDIPSLKLALQTGEVDVSFISSSFVTDLEAAGQVKTVGYAHDWDLPFNAGLWANTAALEDPAKEAAIADFIGRYIDYLYWFVTNPDEVQAVAVAENKVTPEAALSSWNYSRRIPSAITAEVLEIAQSQLSLGYEFGVISTDPEAGTFFDDRFTDVIEAKLAELDFRTALDESLAFSS